MGLGKSSIETTKPALCGKYLKVNFTTAIYIHYTTTNFCTIQTKRPLSDELISKLVNSRAAIAGGFNLRQVVLAIVDQCLHTNPQMESKAIYAKVLKVFIYGLIPECTKELLT